ncbi:MAG: hypothetical protein ACO1G6_03405, partial [Bacteroidota bacterium]
GVVYLFCERKSLIKIQSFVLGAGFMIGAVFFLYIMNEMKEFAIAAGGGNYFLYQGPPVLVKGWKYVISIPYAFYNKFFVANPVSRPLSFLVFVSAFVIILMQIKSKFRAIEAHRDFVLISISVFLTLTVLYLLSGSFGNFNVIVAPFIAIIIAGYFSKMELKVESAKKSTLIIVSLLSVVFASNAIGIGQDVRMAKEYKRMTSHVRSIIDKDSAVLGLALYYNPFKDQPYYSNSWFNPFGGRPEQSFGEAIEALNVKYVIVDDAFVGRALLDRGRGWTDSMFTYLKKNGEVMDEIPANYFVGNRVPDPEFYGEQWRFKEQKKRYIRKVRVIRLNEK